MEHDVSPARRFIRRVAKLGIAATMAAGLVVSGVVAASPAAEAGAISGQPVTPWMNNWDNFDCNYGAIFGRGCPEGYGPIQEPAEPPVSTPAPNPEPSCVVEDVLPATSPRITFGLQAVGMVKPGWCIVVDWSRINGLDGFHALPWEEASLLGLANTGQLNI
jgi:hypothetical protein